MTNLHQRALLACATLALTSFAHADILRWDNHQVIPASVGITPGPGINVSSTAGSSRDFQFANIFNTDLTGSLFTGSNFSSAQLELCILANADFRYAHFDDVNFEETDLANANFAHAGITGATFTNAANFTRTAFESTYSYATHNLTGTKLNNLNLMGWNFSKLYLANANFAQANLPISLVLGSGTKGLIPAATSNLSWANFSSASLHSANLSFANASGANFQGADLTNANLQSTIFRSADLRGAINFNPHVSTFLNNAILPDGTVNFLLLENNENFVVRNSTIPVTIKTGSSISGGATIAFKLEDNFTPLRFEAPPPNGFTPLTNGPDLAGTLDLSFAAGIDPIALIGHSFHIFTFDVLPDLAHRFSSISSPVNLTWDTSSLYTTGIVKLLAASAIPVPVPEPTTLTLLFAPAAALLLRRRKSRITLTSTGQSS